MKHTIQEKRYRKTLYNLDFTINDRYFCQCEEINFGSYFLSIYDTLKDNKELYSNWFTDSLSWDSDNEEYCTLEDIEDIVEEAYRIIESYMITNLKED